MEGERECGEDDRQEGKQQWGSGRRMTSGAEAAVGKREGERQRKGAVEEEELQLMVRGGEWEVSAGRKMTGEDGGEGDGGAAVQRQRRQRRQRRRLEDGGVAKTVEKNRGRGKEWRRSSRRRRRRRWTPSPAFLEQPLEREITPFFLQMTARVCGGVPSPLIEPIMGREGKGPT